MKRNTKAILGIPIDNISLEESVPRIIELAQECKREQISGYISTVNSDFISKIHGISLTKTRQPELLKVLRDSVLATADGKPLIWLSYLLGDPLTERVAGSDLFELIVKGFAEQDLSIYLLGGEEKIIKITAAILTSLYPKIRIAGYSTPSICTEGEELVLSEEKDKKIIEEINRCAPDLLFLNLGNPKQEIWFERIRSHLKVPLSMGVGGSFEMFCKAIPRAPKWMQNIGLEWLFRLSQEPRRLWRRYLYDIVKLSFLAIPLVFYHQMSWLMYKLRSRGKNHLKKPLLFISPERTLSVIQLPPLLGGPICSDVLLFAEEAFCQDVVILDFEKVLHIDLEGISLLITLWQEAARLKKSIFALRASEDVVLLMKFHRMWDLLAATLCQSPDEILAHLVREGTEPALYDTMQQRDREVVVSLFGRLNSELESEEFIEHFAPVLDGKDCTLDLRYCSFINNSGFVCLLKLQEYMLEQNREFKISGLSSELKTLFRVNGVSSLYIPREV